MVWKLIFGCCCSSSNVYTSGCFVQISRGQLSFVRTKGRCLVSITERKICYQMVLMVVDIGKKLEMGNLTYNVTKKKRQYI